MLGGSNQFIHTLIAVIKQSFMVVVAVTMLAGRPLSGQQDAQASSTAMSDTVANAVTFFRRHNYRAALLALGNEVENSKARFIAAESNFRLENYEKAKSYFQKIFDEERSPMERQKALIRLFDCELLGNNLDRATQRYITFSKEFKNPTAQMRYGLGKAFYEAGRLDRAQNVLGKIPQGSEFFLRARYILAALSLGRAKSEASLDQFKQIEKLAPVSVEDFAVRQLAILAQGRIFADMRREDLAKNAYARVSLAGEFGETATIETVRIFLSRASEARLGVRRFAKSSAESRRITEEHALNEALAAIERYRKIHKIDWQKPELLTVMASLYVETKRYDDGRVLYQEMIDHYRRIYDSLLSQTVDEKVWPFFALNFERNDVHQKVSLVEGVPENLWKNLNIEELLMLRHRIEETEKNLRALEVRAAGLLTRDDVTGLNKIRAAQSAMVSSYNAVVLKKQQSLKKSMAETINLALAEAEFKHAQLVVAEMRDLKVQQGAVHEYQSRKVDAFESHLKTDKGGLP